MKLRIWEFKIHQSIWRIYQKYTIVFQKYTKIQQKYTKIQQNWTEPNPKNSKDSVYGESEIQSWRESGYWSLQHGKKEIVTYPHRGEDPRKHQSGDDPDIRLTHDALSQTRQAFKKNAATLLWLEHIVALLHEPVRTSSPRRSTRILLVAAVETGQSAVS